jgi:hypothetical protein
MSPDLRGDILSAAFPYRRESALAPREVQFMRHRSSLCVVVGMFLAILAGCGEQGPRPRQVGTKVIRPPTFKRHISP